MFVGGGIHSLWTWTRRRFEGSDAVDHLLYAVHLTGRIGLWFAIGGLFLIYASIDATGTPGAGRVAEFRWYLLVPLVLAGAQFAAGFALGRRGPSRGREDRS